MDNIKEKIEEIVEKLTKNADLKERFAKEPIKVIEELLGVDLPDETIKKIVDGVKAKIALDKADDIGDKLGDALGALKKLF